MSNVALNRTVASCYENGSTRIPVPKSLHPVLSVDKWRIKYDDSEKKRKNLLVQHERTARDYTELEKKFKQLKLQNTVVESELSDKSEQLRELRTVSQNLYKEYDTLKNQYDLETGAMHRALAEASLWYRQNRQLKRLSVFAPECAITDAIDSTDGDARELEGLRESVKELSGNNARLQTELNEAKLTEFEANEQVINLTQELETVQRKYENLEAEHRDLKISNEQMIRVSKIMSDELKDMHEAEKKQREETVTLRHQADHARKERNVLAHQSTLLLQGIANDDDKIQFLQEIENLKRSLEDMTNKYERDIAQLQEKLEERENDSQAEILEERLKLAESELQRALERAERLENQCAPPPPPPLPPPPAPSVLPVKIASPVVSAPKPDIQDTSPPANDKSPQSIKKLHPQPGIDDIINQIKGGKFTLKSTNNNNKQNKKAREEPKAVSEMLKILGTLRKPKPKNSLNLNKVDIGDVLL